MENKSYEQFIIIQAAIVSKKKYTKAKKKDSDEKKKKITEELKAMFAAITDQINNFKSSPPKASRPYQFGPK